MSIQVKATPNANGNLFEVKTVQAGAFRTLVEALKEILTEANLEFDSQGIKIVAVDETHTVLVYLRLHADRFENFYCPVKHVLGVNMIYLFKLIKTMGNNDSLTLYLPANNPNKLGIRMENTEKSQTTNFFLKLFDTDVEDISIPSLNFTSIIHMNSTDFQKICRDMNVLGEKMEITSSGTNLIFRCMGDFVDGETIIMSNNQREIEVERNTNDIVQGVFELKYLVLFTKCTNLCTSTQIHLKNDYPLVLRYMVANLGEVRLVLAPQKQKSDVPRK
jgi:proliferating cell nuclear antigen